MNTKPKVKKISYAKWYQEQQQLKVEQTSAAIVGLIEAHGRGLSSSQLFNTLQVNCSLFDRALFGLIHAQTIEPHGGKYRIKR